MQIHCQLLQCTAKEQGLALRSGCLPCATRAPLTLGSLHVLMAVPPHVCALSEWYPGVYYRY